MRMCGKGVIVYYIFIQLFIILSYKIASFMRLHCDLSILPVLLYLGRLKGMTILNYHVVALQ